MLYCPDCAVTSKIKGFSGVKEYTDLKSQYLPIDLRKGTMNSKTKTCCGYSVLPKRYRGISSIHSRKSLYSTP